MNVKTNPSPDLNTLTQPQADSTEADYLAWRDAKVRKALADAKALPDQRIPQAEMWKKYGLES